MGSKQFRAPSFVDLGGLLAFFPEWEHKMPSQVPALWFVSRGVRICRLLFSVSRVVCSEFG